MIAHTFGESSAYGSGGETNVKYENDKTIQHMEKKMNWRMDLFSRSSQDAPSVRPR